MIEDKIFGYMSFALKNYLRQRKDARSPIFKFYMDDKGNFFTKFLFKY